MSVTGIPSPPVLVTGATGFVGRFLVPRLLAAGFEVRVLVRDSSKLAGAPWRRQVEITRGDLLDLESLYKPLRGVETAFYLVHSMTGSWEFARRERQCVENFLTAGSSLKKAIYLGGALPEDGDIPSHHLHSRAEVGEFLRSEVPLATEFQAGPIIGAGSASFEMIRHFTENMPVLTVPPWMRHQVRPIALTDVVSYLTLAAQHARPGVFPIGGHPVRFINLLRIYAEVRGLQRPCLPVPALPLGLAAYGVHLLTPTPVSLAFSLVEGAAVPLVGDTAPALMSFPEVQPLTYRESLRLALSKEDVHV